MHLTSLDLGIVVLYFVLLAAFGVVVRRNVAFADYSVARRRVPAALVMASLAATYIGPGYTTGLAGRAFSTGWLFPLLFLFFTLQTLLVGLYLAPRIRAYTSCHTIGDILGERYGPAAQVIAGAISIVLCAGLAAVMGRAGGAILAPVLGLSMEMAVILVTGVGLIYTVTGGLRSVIATEAIQFVVMVVGIGVLTLVVARSVDVEALSQTSLALTSTAMGNTTLWQGIGLALSFLLGETLIPPYANRALASESSQASRAGFVWAGVFSAAWFAMIGFIGMGGKVILHGLEVAEDAVFMEVVAQTLPAGLVGLVLVALAAIVMSSQESVLNAGGVAVVRDLARGSLTNDRKRLLASRVATLVIGLASVFIALRAPSIISGLLICYAIWAPSVLPVLIWAAFRLPSKPAVGISSMIGGAAASTTALLSGAPEGAPILIGLVACGASAAGAWLVTRGRS